MNTSASPFSFLDSMLPMEVTDVLSNIGSMFEIHFAPVEHHEEAGAIQFWVYLSDWKLLKDDREVFNSEGINDENRSRLNELIKGRLMNVDYSAEDNSVSLDFDCGSRLLLEANLNEYEEDDDLLRVYLDGSILFSCNPLNKAYWESSASEH